jgi:hypothetical protein
VSEFIAAAEGGDQFEAGVRAEVPDASPAARHYTYQVHVQPRPGGVLRRWRGRVVTVDSAGRRHHWRWRTARSRQKLVHALWEEAMRDIQWRTGGSSVQIVEVEA